MNRKNISVLGGGSWGTVLAYLASLNGNKVNLWMRDNNLAEEINSTRINQRYLPKLNLGKNITATSQIEDIKESDLIIFCVPSDAFRDVSLVASSFINENTFLVTATKGVEKDDFSLMSKILEEYYSKNLIGILSGPNLAEEIANHHLSGTVIASKHKILRDEVIQNLSTCMYLPRRIPSISVIATLTYSVLDDSKNFLISSADFIFLIFIS